MKATKIKLLSTAVVPALAAAGIALGAAPVEASTGSSGCNYEKAATAGLPAAKAREGYIQLAACGPCAAKNPCNPCAGKTPCNPCAAKWKPCNPCAAKNPCNPCNPCAAKNPCNPCAAKKY